MQKIIIKMLPAICILLLASCSSNDEPKWEDKYPDVDQQVVNSLKNKSNSMFLSNIKIDFFEREDKDSEWQSSTSSSIGHDYGPGRIYISEGKVVVPISVLTSSMGPNLIKTSDAWSAYKYVTKSKESFYLYTTFEPNMDDMTLRMDDRTYIIEAFSDSKVVISDMTDENHKGTLTYTVSDLPEENESDPVAFSSRKEVYQYIIEKARGQFGDVIDLNEVYGSGNYLFPTIDLNELQKELNNNNIR